MRLTLLPSGEITRLSSPKSFENPSSKAIVGTSNADTTAKKHVAATNTLRKNMQVPISIDVL